jgi:hypothetical protein
VIDRSLSMSETDITPRSTKLLCKEGFKGRLGCVLENCEEYINKRKKESKNDLCSLIFFNSTSKIAFKTKKLQDVESEDFLKDKPNNSTNFAKALLELEKVLKESRKYFTSIIFLSDGAHNSSDNFESVMKNIYNNFMMDTYGDLFENVDLENPMNLNVVQFGDDSTEAKENLNSVAKLGHGIMSTILSEVELGEKFQMIVSKLKEY